MASSRVRVLASVLVLLPGAAFAQAQPGASPPAAAPAAPAQGATSPAPQGTSAPAAPAAPSDGTQTAPSGSAAPAASAPPSMPATGYGYSDPKPRGGGGGAPRARRVARNIKGPIATLPGFELQPDGGSRLFVELTQNVPVVEQKAKAGVLTYVLKGAHIAKYNNQNALVTVHFNTPVARARLVPHGSDLLFVVNLRAAVQPTYKVEPAKDNTAILTIDFPKGDYLPAHSAEASDDTQAPADESDGDGESEAPPRPPKGSAKKR